MLLSMCVVAMMAVSVCSGAMDMAAVVADPNQLRSFTLCLVHQGPCTAETEGLRKNIPNVVSEACAHCTPDEKQTFRVYLDGMEKNAPDLYELYRSHYDPDNKYMANLRKALA
ncbi:ejaculatory bulb-specific protein 3-like [Aricia agestis]|uniref:ejaculatory bulb-specific protein 3-like n=1 Tax=Aricia agestis TaxID=91739 RepID=UPI001C206856|nr:ejaculatory bulb-specific protein 3-like [Aricia agestis]